MRKVGIALAVLLGIMLLFSACQNPVLISEEVQARSASGCQYPDYEHGKVYLGGDIVHFQNADYRAKWWTQNEYPPGTSGVWEYLSPCDTMQLITVEITAETGGSVVGESLRQVSTGDDVIIEFATDSGYEIDIVYANWGILEVVDNRVIIPNIQTDTTIRATFKLKNSFSISTSIQIYNQWGMPSHAGTITPSEILYLPKGSNQEYKVQANQGFEILNISVNGESIFPGFVIAIYPPPVFTQHTFSITDLQQDTHIQVTFGPITPVYHTVTATSGPNGSISPEGAISVQAGNAITFNFIPDAGYVIDDVKVNGINVGALSTYTITNVSGDSSIHVDFRLPGPFIGVKAIAGIGGTINPDGKSWVEAGESVTYTITADPGNTIKDIIVNGVSVMPQTFAPLTEHLYTISNIQEETTIEASFYTSTVTNFNVTTTAGQNGNITPSGASVVAAGDTFTFTVLADDWYTIDKIIVNGVALLSSEYEIQRYASRQAKKIVCTTGNIQMNSVIEASFTIEIPLIWQAGETYGPDDLVQYAGVVYRCAYAHTSNSAWIPGTPGLWIWEEVNYPFPL